MPSFKALERVDVIRSRTKPPASVPNTPQTIVSDTSKYNVCIVLQNANMTGKKWSAFTHDRYMEEVDKYSRPGSVAEMKAYFEAHFNRKAAKRSAAQQNVGAPSTSELNVKTEEQQDTPVYHDLAPKDIYVDSEETEPVEAQKSDIGLSVAVCGHSPSHEGRKSENMKIDEIEQTILAENQDGATLEDSATLDKMKCALPFTKSRPPKHPVSLPNRLNVKASPNCKKTAADSTDKRRETARSLRMSINIENKDGATLEDTATSDKKYALPFTKSRLHKPPAPAKPPVSLPNRPNIKASPNKKKTAAESTDKRRETPRSLHMSINFASREINKPLSPILQKIANSRLVKTLAKASKDRTTRQTPALVSPMRPSPPLVKRQTAPSKSQVIISRPPWRLAAKTDGCNDTKGKKCLASSSYAKSVLKKTMHENASPNIQS